jgi:cytidylate kinase
MALVTLTHTVGSEAMEIARRVADRLDVEIYDDARLKEEALRMGLRAEELQGFNEKAPDWFERLWSNKPDVYLHLMESVVFEAARLGEGVIIGHGSQILLQDFNCAMHVLVTGQIEGRVRNLMHQMNLSREAAEGLIRKSDSRKRGFFQYAFHKNWDDPALYDVCVNPDKVGVERAAQLVYDMARSPELKACSIYARDALERLSQTKRIEAALLEMALRHAGLRVAMPEKGVAQISGVLYNHEDKGRIPEIVSRIPGVEKVELDVSMMPAAYD